MREHEREARERERRTSAAMPMRPTARPATSNRGELTGS
jgi:hypothetical protein